MTGTKMKQYPIKQIDAVLQVLIDAHDHGAWLTVPEIANATGLPDMKETSVSAQIRNLRKPENGGYIIHKRLRVHDGHLILYEFKIVDETATENTGSESF